MSTLARRQGEVVATGGDTIIRSADGAEHLLSPEALAVWSAADGTLGIESLVEAARAADPKATRQTVFAVLDDLAAAGLLAERVAPPAMLGRRSLFKTLAAGAAAAAVLAPAIASSKEICADASAFKESENLKKSAEKKQGQEEEKRKKEYYAQEAAQKKQGGKQEQEKKKQEANHEKEEKAAYKKLGNGDTSEEKAKQAWTDLKQKQEEEQKELVGIHDEEARKQSEAVQESKVKAEALDGAGCCSAERQGIMEEDAKKRSQFGQGYSMVFIDLPGGLTIQAETRLESIVVGVGDGCDTQMDLLFDGLSGDDAGALAKTLVAYANKGVEAGIQWGASGEFAATATLKGGNSEIVGTSETYKSTSHRVRIRWTHVAYVQK